MIPASCVGLFHGTFFAIDSRVASFFLSCASLFILAVGFLLAWYYSSCLIRRRSMNALLTFGRDAIEVSVSKISMQDVLESTDFTVTKLMAYEDASFELLGFSIPFLSLFATTAFVVLYTNPTAIPLLTVSCIMVAIALSVVTQIVKICDISQIKNTFSKFVRRGVAAAEGIQYYRAAELVVDKFAIDAAAGNEVTQRTVAKRIWEAFALVCILFGAVCLGYIVDARYMTDHLFDVSGIEIPFFCCMFCFSIFLVSIFRYMRTAKEDFDDFSCDKPDIENDVGLRTLPPDNLFITFHGVYFQDPATPSYCSIFEDLTFSVLPGEFISITGENAAAGEYVFALILKYYSPQSGKIYISGMRAENISTMSVRSAIGVLKEDFGLIHDTIYGNIMMATHDADMAMRAMRKTGLDSIYDVEVFDDDGNMAVDQETLLRLQFARISITNPKIVLITTPSKFASDSTEELFYEIVEHMSKRKTIIMITDNPNVFIYSDKILYVSGEGSAFGSHADLAKNVRYQNYVSRYRGKV
jgi:ABC-type multidrug transport system fused ATPase/permease subunit